MSDSSYSTGSIVVGVIATCLLLGIAIQQIRKRLKLARIRRMIARIREKRLKRLHNAAIFKVRKLHRRLKDRIVVGMYTHAEKQH